MKRARKLFLFREKKKKRPFTKGLSDGAQPSRKAKLGEERGLTVFSESRVRGQRGHSPETHHSPEDPLARPMAHLDTLRNTHTLTETHEIITHTRPRTRRHTLMERHTHRSGILKHRDRRGRDASTHTHGSGHAPIDGDTHTHTRVQRPANTYKR